MKIVDLHQSFYLPIRDYIQGEDFTEKGRMAIISKNSSSMVQEFAEAGWKTEVISAASELRGRYTVILTPDYFHAISKEQAQSEAPGIAESLEMDGLLACFFPPAWFPIEWQSKANHYHVEKKERLIVRFDKDVHTFTLFSNREILALFESLKSCQLITQRSGFRRIIFKNAREE